MIPTSTAALDQEYRDSLEEFARRKVLNLNSQRSQEKWESSDILKVKESSPERERKKLDINGRLQPDQS